MTTPRPLRLLALLATVLLLAAACSSSDDDAGTGAAGDTTTTAGETTTAPAESAAPATLDVTSTDFAYALDTDTVPAGLVTVTQTNDGEENHQITLVRLEDGQTTADVAAGLAGPEADHFVSNDAYAGGPNSTVAGGTDTSTVELAEGSYGLFCFIPSQDGESHFQKGMVAELTVTPAEGTPAEPPETDGTITMSDYTYDVPADFTGHGTYEVVNDGPQVHELTVSNADNTVGGGLTAISPGATAYVDLDLPDGDYSFVCFVGDEDTGAPHFTLGMSVPVTIGSGGSPPTTS